MTGGVTEGALGGTLVRMDDVEAFASLYEREGEPVLVFLARRTLDVEVAMDLTAETFAIALSSWRRLCTLAPEQARAWLFTVARRRHSRYLRTARVESRAVRRLGIQVPRVHEDDLAAVEERAGLPRLRALLRDELEHLSEGQREALRLRVVEERSYEEVARRLGVTEQTAERAPGACSRRGRQSCVEWLSDRRSASNAAGESPRAVEHAGVVRVREPRSCDGGERRGRGRRGEPVSWDR
jgi:RNA polymerase sigma factor (sigma-70 family)